MAEGTRRVRELTRLAMLFALTLLLMAVEGMLPPVSSVPGIKLGLSNVVVMYTLFYFGRRPALVLALLKSLFVLLARGGMTAFFMSLAGGMCSVFIMILLLSLKKQKLSYIIISICASIGHNVGQLAAASVYMQSGTVWFYAPVLIISGVAMGCVTGVLLRVLMPVMGRISGRSESEAKLRKGKNGSSNFNDVGGHNGDHQQ